MVSIISILNHHEMGLWLIRIGDIKSIYSAYHDFLFSANPERDNNTNRLLRLQLKVALSYQHLISVESR